MNRNPMTKKGAERLREELQRLKSEDRPKIIAAIAEARAHGDLKENAEYHAAKEQQGFIETRISDIEGCLGAAEIIDPATIDAQGRVVFGATVELARVDDDEKTVRYQLVGDLEADIGAGLVSVSSPLARALIGKEEGDSVSVDAPGGKIEYEIISVEYI
ncbi:MAG: transcription elongation factor GreA [Ectothiorhodospiraceae bacterium AqS1]|nr:transcription elongation factor GreA [Ectothiorhodospiraceae bacterium AqS1]